VSWIPHITARRTTWLILLGLLVCLPMAHGCDRLQGPSTAGNDARADQAESAVPGWVTTTPESDLDYDRFVVHGELYATKQDARAAHETKYEQLLREFLDPQLLKIAGTSDAVEEFGYQVDQLDSHVDRTSVYLETKVTSVGTMYQFHSLVEMSNGIHDKLQQMWGSFQGVNRAMQLALGWLALLGAVGIFAHYLESSWQHRAALSAGLGMGLTLLLVIASQWIYWI
jgi:hypothetical protein